MTVSQSAYFVQLNIIILPAFCSIILCVAHLSLIVKIFNMYEVHVYFCNAVPFITITPNNGDFLFTLNKLNFFVFPIYFQTF